MRVCARPPVDPWTAVATEGPRPLCGPPSCRSVSWIGILGVCSPQTGRVGEVYTDNSDANVTCVYTTACHVRVT